MYSPQAKGGHAEYTHELLTAMASLSNDERIDLQLITASDLDTAYHSDSYEIRNILPPQRLRSTFLTPIHFALDRYILFRKRENRLVQIVALPTGSKICHLQELTPWNAAGIIQRLKSVRTKVIYTVHNIYPHHTFGLPRSLIESQLRRAWKCCDGLLVHTDGLKIDLQNFLGTDHPPIFITPHGVWNTATKVSLKERLQRIRENPNPRILIFGHLRPNKGVDVCVEAMQFLPDARLTIAGHADRAVAAAITSRIRHLSLEDKITFYNGYISETDVEQLFASHDICLLAYRNFHAQSGVLYKAAAFGVPLVVSDVGAIGITVKLYELGEVIEGMNPAAIADAVRRLLHVTQYEKSLAGLKRLAENNTWLQTAKATIDAYNSVTHE